jgi:hypothetical protein
MNSVKLAAAAVLAAVLAPAPALADDPNDPAMKDPRARARDAEMIRQLNRDMLAQVRERDAKYAQGWQDAREYPQREAQYQAALAAYARSNQAYAHDRADYETRMAQWRRAVELCRAGRTEYCEG